MIIWRKKPKIEGSSAVRKELFSNLTDSEVLFFYRMGLLTLSDEELTESFARAKAILNKVLEEKGQEK